MKAIGLGLSTIMKDNAPHKADFGPSADKFIFLIVHLMNMGIMKGVITILGAQSDAV